MIKLNFKKKNFLESESVVEFRHEEKTKFFYLDVNLYSEKFKEYQKNLFSDFFSKVLDLNEKYDNFLDFKRGLESEIKQFNVQLKVFQEKVNLEDKIDIRWSLQIVWNENYISALIGETSLIIVRKWKLESVIINEVEPEDQIDIFSEIIEWELEDSDKIVQVNCNIYNYLSDSEIKEIIQSDDIILTLQEVLITRIPEKEIGFISVLDFKFEKIITQNVEKEKLDTLKENILKYKYPIAIISGIVIIILLIIWIFSYVSQTPNKVITTIDGKKVTLNVDLDNLKRQIDAFSKLDNTNTQLAKQQYEQIMKKLNELEQAKIQVLEIKELKKKMEQLYFKGFHINIVTDNDGLLNYVYSFSNDELSQLSGLKQVVYTNGFLNVVGNKGVLLNLISNNVKWTLQKVTLPTEIKTCSSNLSKNWLYCVLDNDNIYNFSKYGTQAVKNLANSWPTKIGSIGIYGVNKFYVLTKDEKFNSQNAYIVRYVLQGRNLFGKPNSYVFSDKVDDKIVKWIFTGSTLAIDGTFLIWTKEGLVQVYRKNYMDTKVLARVVPGWEKWIISDKDFKGKVKVISWPNDKYVYLYDYNTSSLVVYLTSPYKTNDAYTTSYKLRYLFKVRFDLSNPVKDVTVIYNPAQNRRTVYVLTTKGIFKTTLEEFMNN